jgi:DNA-binding CsgD family transcriptional regulator
LPAGPRAEAVGALERAAALHEQCGGTWRRDRALEALRRLGTAGRRAAAAALGPGSLTRREQEVARLAATGMNAKEIAETLFVGKRTVESHLASVYAKLGVDSKLQLVRRAAELGLT